MLNRVSAEAAASSVVAEDFTWADNIAPVTQVPNAEAPASSPPVGAATELSGDLDPQPPVGKAPPPSFTPAPVGAIRRFTAAAQQGRFDIEAARDMGLGDEEIREELARFVARQRGSPATGAEAPASAASAFADASPSVVAENHTGAATHSNVCCGSLTGRRCLD